MVRWSGEAYSNIDVVQRERDRHEIAAETRSNDERDGQDERREQVQKRLVDLLKDEEFGAQLPPAEFPGAEDVGHVVVHAIDEEEVCENKSAEDIQRRTTSHTYSTDRTSA